MTQEEIYHPALDIDLIKPSPTNPRKHLTGESIAEMADSIKAHGVAQPILVRPRPRWPGFFEIVFGERRYRGALRAGLTTIKAIQRDLDDLTVAELQLVENLQREDVHELDEANGYRELMDRHKMTALQIAGRISKSEKYVYDRLKLLRLVPGLQELFLAKKMTAGHAILLARLPAGQQEPYAKGEAAAAFATLSVRELGRIVKNNENPPLPPAPGPRTNNHFTHRDHATAMLRAAAGGDPEAHAAIGEILRSHLSVLGSKGSRRRNQVMTKSERQASARTAANARWHPAKKVQTSAVGKKAR